MRLLPRRSASSPAVFITRANSGVTWTVRVLLPVFVSVSSAVRRRASSKDTPLSVSRPLAVPPSRRSPNSRWSGLRYLVERRGAENYAGLPIVASGPRAALPHSKASDRKVQRGEFVLFDFGAIVDGYLSDMTRTVVCGEASPKQREVCSLIHRAEEAGVTLIREGVTGQTVDRTCRRPLHEGGYGDWTHGYSVGYGLGLEVHEDPFMSEEYLAPLEVGMVVTVEPGIYIPGWGGVRTEDTVLVTQNGCEVFNTSSRDLLKF